MKRYVFLKVAVIAFTLMFATSMSCEADTKGTPAPEAQVKTAVSGKLIDINTAMDAQLMTLPDIGDAYAKKIIENRPYKKKAQLVSKKIIPKATYKKIKDKIIAK
jgi:DNA uptake protein ComE-like DNA-binding protein